MLKLHHIVLFNRNKVAKAVYAFDGSHVMIHPKAQLKVLPKFEWQLPKGVTKLSEHNKPVEAPKAKVEAPVVKSAPVSEQKVAAKS
jgi:hypothetical protein